MNKPNYILTQAFAYKKLDEAPYIKTHEIALYNALFRLWNSSYFKTVIDPTRRQLMKISKIGNEKTLKKALMNLQLAGVLLIAEKAKNNDQVPVKMIGVFEDNDLYNQIKVPQGYVKNDSKEGEEMTGGRGKSVPRVGSKVPQHIKQENNSKHEEKKRKSFLNY